MPLLPNGEMLELMAPAGSRESLTAALEAGAEAVYFGVESLNMRAHSANRFTIGELPEIVRACHARGAKAYLTVNTIVYDADLSLMEHICDEAKACGVDAVIASDVAVLTYCRRLGQEIHLSTQLNVANVRALRFYAQFAETVVLARELNLGQVADVRKAIDAEPILSPTGKPVRIEMFCHGALCMAVSGKCYLSLDNANKSANRGECMQLCRRGYEVTDIETGAQLHVDNQYIMSPKDLNTIGFLDKMVEAGVRVFKIEGRARSADYVFITVSCYREALQSIAGGTLCRDKVEAWNARLATVFNRGFWDGYYLGRRLGEWNARYGSSATERKVYVGRVVKYFSRIGVGEFLVEAAPVKRDEKLLVIGPTTGALYFTASEIRYELRPVGEAFQGQDISIPVPSKIRPGDKLYKIVPAEP